MTEEQTEWANELRETKPISVHNSTIHLIRKYITTYNLDLEFLLSLQGRKWR